MIDRLRQYIAVHVVLILPTILTGLQGRKGVDAMSGVNGEVVLASPKACPADVCIEPVAGEVVNIGIRMAPIHKIHAYL